MKNTETIEATEPQQPAKKKYDDIQTPEPVVEETDSMRYTVIDYREYFDKHRKAISV